MSDRAPVVPLFVCFRDVTYGLPLPREIAELDAMWQQPSYRPTDHRREQV